MNRRGQRQPSHIRSFVALLATALLLAGCASSVPTASPPVTATQLPTATPPLAPTPAAPATPVAVVSTPTLLPAGAPTASPTEAVTPEPTATVLPTETPEPTPTPLPTPTPRPMSGPNLAVSAVARAAADPAAAKTAASSINAFGLDFFRQLLTDPTLALSQKNTVFSPTSIALALAMARAGARGETASQMDAVLHTSGWDALGPGLSSLSQALASRDAAWQDYDGTKHALALRIANAAFGQQGWKIEPPYLDAIASAFGAGLSLADFASDPEASRQTINAWVSDQTNKRIRQLLRSGDVDTLTRLVLVNAIYLKAAWELGTEFNQQETKPAPFTRLDGSQVAVPTMHTTSLGLAPLLPYVSGTGWQATELRYQGVHGTTPLAMTLLLPKDLVAFEASLTASQLTRITSALASQRENVALVPCPDHPGGQCYPYRVSLFMPRFGIETRADLDRALTALGMPLAFAGRADFTVIHRPSEIHIGVVVHQANIDVDEKGTEAAAATAVGMTGGPGSGAAKTITLRLDHPFLFFVRDLDTGAVLFMGQVTDPSAGKGS